MTETAGIMYEIEPTDTLSPWSVMESGAAAYLHCRPFSSVWEMPSMWFRVFSPVDTDKSTSHASMIMVGDYVDKFAPRTSLADKLLRLRQKAVDAGMRLLDADEVLEEVKRRRGEVGSDETDLY